MSATFASMRAQLSALGVLLTEPLSIWLREPQLHQVISSIVSVGPDVRERPTIPVLALAGQLNLAIAQKLPKSIA